MQKRVGESLLSREGKMKDERIAGGYKMNRLEAIASGQKHVKGETDPSQKKDYICPVCGKGLGDQVPDKESVLDELLYD